MLVCVVIIHSACIINGFQWGVSFKLVVCSTMQTCWTCLAKASDAYSGPEVSSPEFTELLHMCWLSFFLVQLKVTNEDTCGLLSLSCQGCLLALQHYCQRLRHKNAPESLRSPPPSLSLTHVQHVAGFKSRSRSHCWRRALWCSSAFDWNARLQLGKTYPRSLSSIIYCKTLQLEVVGECLWS